MAGDETPRRMRRFYRGEEKPSEEEVKQKSTEMAIKKVDEFRETHNRYPKNTELDDMSDSVFEQLKKELEKPSKQDSIAEQISLEGFDEKEDEPEGEIGGRRSFLEKRKARRELAKEGAAKKEEKTAEKETEETMQDNPEEPVETNDDANDTLSMEEDFSLEGSTGKAREDSISELAKLEELASLEGDLDSEDQFDLIGKEKIATINSCPNCNDKAKELIYCPNCGTAFCDHCAKKVEVLQDSIKYTCPKCGSEFRKKKK